jgi:hypothetical protein
MSARCGDHTYEPDPQRVLDDWHCLECERRTHQTPVQAHSDDAVDAAIRASMPTDSGVRAVINAHVAKCAMRVFTDAVLERVATAATTAVEWGARLTVPKSGVGKIAHSRATDIAPSAACTIECTGILAGLVPSSVPAVDIRALDGTRMPTLAEAVAIVFGDGMCYEDGSMSLCDRELRTKWPRLSIMHGCITGSRDWVDIVYRVPDFDARQKRLREEYLAAVRGALCPLDEPRPKSRAAEHS